MRKMPEDLSAYSFGELLKSLRKRVSLGQQELARQLSVHRNTIGMWERGETLPDSRTMVLELARKLYLDEQLTRLLLEASLTTVLLRWQVPYPRNPFFTGREALLRSLHEIFRQKQVTTRSQSCTLSGLGGMGKTTTALEYAYRYADEYTAIFWLNASSASNLWADLRVTAHILNLPEKNEHEQRQLKAAVVRWLNSHRCWLLIVDNVEDAELIKEFLPAAGQGALLLTTRHQTSGLTAHTYELKPLSAEESTLFLLHRSRLLAPSETLEHLVASAKSDAQEIVQIVGGLPLALDQAGAYIEETQCNLETYLHLLQSQPGQFWRERRGAPDPPPARESPGTHSQEPD